jgi:hypothetical protein
MQAITMDNKCEQVLKTTAMRSSRYAAEHPLDGALCA